MSRSNTEQERDLALTRHFPVGFQERMLKHANNKLLWGEKENPAIYQTHVERLRSSERCCRRKARVLHCLHTTGTSEHELSCSANLIFILKDRRAGRNAMSSVTYCICWESAYYSKEGHRLGSCIRLSWPMGKTCNPRIRRWNSHISGGHFSFQLQVQTIKNYFDTINNMKLLEFSCMK